MPRKNIDPIAVEALRAGLLAEQAEKDRVHAEAGSVFDDDFDLTKARSGIDHTLPYQIADLLEKARSETPPFLRGVLVSEKALHEIGDMLSRMAHDLESGRRFEHQTLTSWDAGQRGVHALMAGMVTSILAAPDEEY